MLNGRLGEIVLHRGGQFSDLIDVRRRISLHQLRAALSATQASDGPAANGRLRSEPGRVP